MKEQLDTRSRRATLLSAAFSALAGLSSSDRAASALAAATTTTSTSTATPPPLPPLSPPAPPAGWSYSSRGRDWPSLGFDSCGIVGQQSPINISPPFTRIRPRGRRGGQQQQEQQPFLELSADYRSAAFDAVVERGVTASPKFTVVAAVGKEGKQREQREQRHPAGGIFLHGGGSENDGENGGEKVFYPLVQFHFHRPGEESLEGRRGVLGAHLVHQRDDDEDLLPESGSPSTLLLPRFVVVAVAFDLCPRGGSPDPALDDLFFDDGGENNDIDWKDQGPSWRRIEAFDPSRLLPASSLPLASPGARLENFFAFDGSLTTPPCTRGARFYFVKGRKRATAEQVSRVVLPRGAQNARPLQERGDRVVWEG